MKTERPVARILFFLFLTTAFFCILLPSWLSAARPFVYVVTLEDDTINPVTADYISSALTRAASDGAQAVVIKLDTPGGLLNSTRILVKNMLASQVPVIVYIAPSGSRAGSAGVFITYASHLAAMAPSTHMGAAHPVRMGGDEQQRTIWDALRDLLDNLARRDRGQDRPEEAAERTAPMEDKILNDTVAFIRAMAEERGRNVEWGIRSVTESATITETEALEQRVVELIAVDERDLLQEAHGKTLIVQGREITLDTRDAEIRRLAMDFRQRFLNVLANPNISYILLMLGFYGLLFEVTNPGLGVPGVLGTIFIILALYSLQTLPINYAGLGLILLGMLLLGAEMMVPGFGLLALGGAVCVLLGSLFLFQSPHDFLQVSMSLVFAFTLTTAVITMALVRLVVKSHRLKTMTGMTGMVGLAGEAHTDFGPGREGKIFAHGEVWNAVSEEEIKEGDKIEIIGHDGMILRVAKK